MNFGENMSRIRKEKGLSRENLGKMIGTSSAIIGRYERNDMTPSVEIAIKIAEALDVSLDYLVGKSSSQLIKDKQMLERLERIENMAENEKSQLFNVVDALIRDSHTKQAYAH